MTGVICWTLALQAPVIPAKAGIHFASCRRCSLAELDSRFRGNDCHFVMNPIPNGACMPMEAYEGEASSRHLLAVQSFSVPQPARPKLGQHFLRDRRFQRRIVDSLAIQSNDLVCEIGPGRGAMTELLAARARQVVAIEVDHELAKMLQQKFSNKLGIEILEADILLSDLAALCRRYQREQCFVFGNLPYYITSPILHHLLDFASSISGMGLVVQREVAERLSARPGSRHYGYLTVLTQLATNPHIEFGIPPGAFSPPPKVDSALVTFQIKPEGIQLPAEQWNALLEFVKLCFAHKRKNLLNNLAPVYARQHVERELGALNLPLTIRAEQLTLEQFEELLALLR